MNLSEPIRVVETALGNLSRASADSSGWSDRQRAAFDAQRLTPLLEAGRQLTAALKSTQDQVDRADRMCCR